MTGVHDTAHYASQRDGEPSSPIELLLPQPLLEAIRRHGEETYPHECCGILLGTSSLESMVVQDVLRAGNTRLDSAHNRYNIEPIDLIRAQREARIRSLDIIGFYHSHPDHPAFWSPTDLAEAHWYGCSYLITSIDGSSGTPSAHTTNAFLLTGTTETDREFARQRVVSTEA